ncbi:MAG: hypothetical protein ACFBSF_17990 [Leptolyngbyaceae cyanobacterium]
MANYGHIVNSFPLRMSLGCYPWLFYPLYSLVPINRQLAVNPTTELVIEGFPRSANTFAVLAFEHSQSRKVSIAHHMHVPAQIIRAAYWKIPTLVLVRKPQDAIASYVMRKSQLSLDDALKCYIRFYTVALQYTESYVTASFEEATGNFAAIVERINQKFGTSFVALTPKDEDLEKIFERTNNIAQRNGMGEMGIARPSAERSARKQELIAELQSPKYQSLLGSAKDIYLEFHHRGLLTDTPL